MFLGQKPGVLWRWQSALGIVPSNANGPKLVPALLWGHGRFLQTKWSEARPFGGKLVNS